jgi:hypothetical protein
MYKNKSIKPDKIVLRWGGRIRKLMEGENVTKIYSEHIYKCDNETALCN